MKKIYLIRHAQSESNAGVAIRPNHEINITELGKTQANELADWLQQHIDEPITDIFISRYLRTQQTAEPFLTKTARTAMIIDDLHEFNYLDFEHIKLLNLAEIRQMAEDFWQKPSNFQDSEQTDSFVNFVQRVKNVRTFFDNLPNGTYVVFTHGMWLGMLIWQVLHADGKRVFNQQKFREFELAIRPKNCEVFLLKDNTVAKVRVRTDGDDVDIR
ncbi:histidine phosphatase family protein [Faucicola mancuniensis]|uniref:histidine phosphatase family protein n=1 Tax=Faucicola mancuniensis TaxID=1309795 RepID=UPI0028EEADE2|nr:histidine phosphatase family protein [uncultured Moraxella sp.]